VAERVVVRLEAVQVEEPEDAWRRGRPEVGQVLQQLPAVTQPRERIGACLRAAGAQERAVLTVGQDERDYDDRAVTPVPEQPVETGAAEAGDLMKRVNDDADQSGTEKCPYEYRLAWGTGVRQR